jgi:predicted  nucleic acid-binding Zn-ribbon protein
MLGPMAHSDPDWLGDLRWRGYPRMEPVRDASALPTGDVPPRARRAAEPESDARLAELARENEGLRARLEALSRLAAEFERRLTDAGTAYESAVLEAESKLRDASLERERLTGELEAARDELARSAAREAGRDADLRLERERRADAERALAEARRKSEERAAEAERVRAAASEQTGQLAELRRQAAAQNERLVQAKALTDEDVRLLRQEMREFLAKFHRIQESFGENS